MEIKINFVKAFSVSPYEAVVGVWSNVFIKIDLL